eukprot:SAG11_NODE_687_length_7719_cov_1.975328_4_plen_106_part_00
MSDADGLEEVLRAGGAVGVVARELAFEAERKLTLGAVVRQLVTVVHASRATTARGGGIGDARLHHHTSAAAAAAEVNSEKRDDVGAREPVPGRNRCRFAVFGIVF